MSTSTISGVSGLNEQDFLNLLATELENQDPMNPVDDSQFMSELAQFSSLQAADATNTSVNTLVTQTTQMQASQLVGRTVAGVQSSTNTSFSGVVQGVDLTGSTPAVVVNNQDEKLTDIQYIE